MSDDPIINRWRLLLGTCHPPYLGILVGEISGHPLCGDGWNSTSPVIRIDRAGKRARTHSRWYRLGEEIPATEPLPVPARQALLYRYMRERSDCASTSDLIEIVVRLSRPLAEGSA